MVQLPNTVDPMLSIESVTQEDGGHYVCKCLPNGPECMYNVSGKYFISDIFIGIFLHAVMLYYFRLNIFNVFYSSSRNDI